MSIELLVNTTPLETRVALLEGGVLQEIFIERASRRGLVGNLYKGRITRVLPGMQAAFVEVGLARSAFLHADDIVIDDAAVCGLEVGFVHCEHVTCEGQPGLFGTVVGADSSQVLNRCLYRCYCRLSASK